MRACVRACVRASVRACVRGSERACVRGYELACEHARVRLAKRGSCELGIGVAFEVAH